MPLRLILLIVAGLLIVGIDPQTTVAGDEPRVVPIDWNRFARPATVDDDYRRAAQLLANAASYQVAWIPDAAERIEKDWRNLSGRQNHDVIRPACEAALTLAVALKTDVYGPALSGVSREEGSARTRRLIHAAAVAHDGNHWKYPWQSALWATDLGQAAWLLWDELDPPTRELVEKIVVAEADRLQMPFYRRLYWNGTDGNTQAEENAWDSMILTLAAAMLPNHPHVMQWKTMGSRLMVSSYSLPADMDSDTVLDGKPLRQWLEGYNMREDGALINHNILHPDYMTCVNLKLHAYLLQSLARQTVSETAEFRADFVYRTLVTKRWESPPYKAPGGTIYVPGQGEVYYPQGTDWFKGRLVIYYLFDTYAHVLGFGGDLPVPAADWMRLRADAILARQESHGDRRIYNPGEFSNFPAREQSDAMGIAQALLLQWLRVRGAVAPRGNWLSQSR
ncbi:MAG: hypothetical protein GXY83_43945 [Rhodopirellula sp.]|nr:hypothetical protein [Rhodopirellula sp.]